MSVGTSLSELPQRPPDGPQLVDGSWLQALYDYVAQSTPRGDGKTVFATPRKNGTLLSAEGGPGGTTSTSCPFRIAKDESGNYSQVSGKLNSNYGFSGGFNGDPTLVSGAVPASGYVWLAITYVPTVGGTAGSYYAIGYTISAAVFTSGAAIPANVCADVNPTTGAVTNGTAHLSFATITGSEVVYSMCGDLFAQICGDCDVRIVTNIMYNQ